MVAGKTNDEKRKAPFGDAFGKEKERKEATSVTATQKTKEISTKEIRSIRAQNAHLKEQIEKKESSLKRMQIMVRKVKADYEIELRKDSEIARRNRTIKNLKELLREQEKMTDSLEKIRFLWVGIANNDIFPVTAFPEISKFVLLKRKLRKGDIDKLRNDVVSIVFTDDKGNESLLKNMDIDVKKSSLIKKINDFHYVKKSALLMSDGASREGSNVLLEKLVNGYREERKKG